MNTRRRPTGGEWPLTRFMCLLRANYRLLASSLHFASSNSLGELPKFIPAALSLAGVEKEDTSQWGLFVSRISLLSSDD